MSERSAISSYDPPRAGRAAGLWRAWFGYCRACPRFGHFITVPLEKIADGWLLFPIFCVPLLGLLLAGRPLLRRFGPPLFVLAAFFALACVGQTGGGVALGLMAAIHAIGIAEYLDEHVPAGSRTRIILRRGCLALACSVLALWFSPPVVRWLVVPVGSAQGPLLCNPFARTPPFPRQAVVAFHLPNHQQHGLRINEGVNLGRVIACPGDQVSFSPGAVTVNGVRHRALPLMPTSGTVHVPTGHTLVWPVDLQSSGRRFGGTLEPQPFVVSDSALVGRPYKRWFWRTFNP